jgi:ribosomal protein L37AE/L43A
VAKLGYSKRSYMMTIGLTGIYGSMAFNADGKMSTLEMNIMALIEAPLLCPKCGRKTTHSLNADGWKWSCIDCLKRVDASHNPNQLSLMDAYGVVEIK